MLKGIGNYQGFDYSAYNRINAEQVTKRPVQESAQATNEKIQEAPSRDLDLRLSDIRPRQNASLEDITLSLNEPNGFEMKGRESDIDALDMEKAVSDMQKDQALMQYQYFVGEQGIMNSEDGIVIAK
ncbi:MAG: hypothetical protein J5367_02015 [Lachnospiraceae bacterium]|nr:hypothetical protein [Lachnospiraceae bacterium]